MGGLFKSQTISNSEPRIGALRIQSSTQGLPTALVYGTTRISPNLIDYIDFRAIPHTTSQDAGGKGGETSVQNTSYTYEATVIFGLCEGPIIGLDRIWKGKEQTSVGGLGFEWFRGEDGQPAWSTMATKHPERALGYSGTAYIAHGAFPLGSSDSLPNMGFEVWGLGPGGNPPGVSVCTPDVNPAFILQDLLTHPRYGAGLNPAQLANLSGWLSYCQAANLLCSPAYTQQRSAAEIVEELARIGNAGLVWSEGRLKVVPYADQPVSHTPFRSGGGPNPQCCQLGDSVTYEPDVAPVYDLTHDDFLAPPGTDPVRVRRKRQADAFNAVQVECLDRSNEYNVYVAEARDQANIDRYGLRVMEPVTLHAICDVAIARNVAQIRLQRELYVRNTYQFTLGWRYGRLEPMDIVTLTEPGLGLEQTLVRIVSVDENEDGELAIEAEDLTIGVATAQAYATQPTAGHVVDNNEDPGSTRPPVIFQPPVELSGVPQIWIGAAGGESWGGAQVWVSNDDETYTRAGTITAPARYGVLTAALPAGANPDTVHTLSVDLSPSGGTLTSATPSQADTLGTLAYIGSNGSGELIAYSTATLTGPNRYDLSGYIKRGQRCTLSEAHAAGESFLRLDGAVQRFNVTEASVGQTLYVKLLSFNRTGGGQQTLDQVSAIEYLVQPLGVVAVNGAVPSTVTAQQVLCIPPTGQYSVQGRMTCAGRINCDGRLIVS